MTRIEFRPDADRMTMEATLMLPAWAAMGGAVDYPRFRHLPQDGSLMVYIANDDFKATPLTPRDEAIVLDALADTEGLRRLLLADTMQRYDAIRSEYRDECGFEEDDEFATQMPLDPTMEDLARLIRPICLHVHLARKDGRPYVGIETQPQWDQEHGLGILVNGDRVVARGAGDVAWAGYTVKDDMAS